MATVSIIFNVAQGWHELMSPFLGHFSVVIWFYLQK